MIGDVQREAAEWRREMFPGQPPHHGLLGFVEELGELVSAKTAIEAEDAVADAAIFLLGYCSAHGIEIERTMRVVSYVDVEMLLDVAGRLCRAQLKGEQERVHGAEPRYDDRDWNAVVRETVVEAFTLLATYGEQRGIAFERALDNVWKKVRERSRGDP